MGVEVGDGHGMANHAAVFARPAARLQLCLTACLKFLTKASAEPSEAQAWTTFSSEEPGFFDS
jgi:hypothetical protein